MSKETLKIGVDLGTEKDEQCAVINLHYNGIDHIIYETHDKEQVETLSKIMEAENQKLIGNSTPSEALLGLQHIKKYYIPEPCSAKTYDYLQVIKQALLELKSIKEVNPSEALECVNDLENFYIDEYVERYDNNLQVIKNYILKAQEPKHYLKWEDLEFTEEDKEIFVLLNGTKYKLKCYKSGNEDTSIMIVLNGIVVADLCSIFYKADKQFFNDLHLERVE